VTPVLRHGLARLRADPGRALLTAGGTAAAAAMVGAAATLVLALATGFDRTAARAGLPDVTASFSPEPLDAVDARVRALPNLRGRAYRLEVKGVDLRANGHGTSHAVVEGVRGGRRGYAVVDGRDVSAPGDVVVEHGLARSWKLSLGSTLVLSDYGYGAFRIVGIAVEPDTVAYPLVRSPRVYVRYGDASRLAQRRGVDVALLWVHDPHRLDVTLAQARSASYGVVGLQFLTRTGYRRLIGRGAGLVIALLVGFSIVALAAAGLMLAAAAAAEVQRRLEAIGILRALGASPGQITSGYGLEAAVVAAPAATVGVAVGWLAVTGPSARLLALLNQLPPSALASVLVLAGCLVGIVAVVVAATAVPAWRAARRPPVDALRGADVVGTPRRVGVPGLTGLGARLALARPLRVTALACVLAASAAVVLLMLTLASLMGRLEHDAQTLGTKYQLTASAGTAAAARIRTIPGVAAVAPRYEVEAADSFDLGESFQVIAFPGDHTRYEAPPLERGRRVARDDEAEVGAGLADALNLHPGSMLAAQLPSAAETRFRVVGIVEALLNQGLVAYARPPRLLRAMPSLAPTLVVRLRPGADSEAVRTALERQGLYAEHVGGIAEQETASGSLGRTSFLHVLAALLRSVAVLDGLVCLYALAQMLALIARERRRAVAVVRAVGACRAQVLAVFAGSALLVAALAAPVGIVAERVGLGPEVGHLAASYVTLPLRAGAASIVAALGGLALSVALAAALATRSAVRDSIATPLREE
jgi:ABC-type antimicrobial peptide transport system permease subunit